MEPERWERVQDLLYEALEREPHERGRFVEEVAAGDPELAEELRSLIDSHDEEGILDGKESGGSEPADQFERVCRALTGRYALEAEAGRGGMATVYRAEDLKHHRAVAIKVLHPFLAHSIGVDRFLAEIETTAGLQHPHVLPLFDSGEADGFLYYVMPFVEGESLRHRLDREAQLSIEDAVQIARGVAQGLDYAHRRGVVHRDIKPGNVLLQDGQPAVSDFGIALAVGVARSDRLTQVGYSLGTPRYMSPEQARGDENVGPASDIYSLGCVLHEMLVGEPPFPGRSADSVLRQIDRGLAVPPREIRASIPANVDAAIRKALEKVPADRFASAKEFARALADDSFRHGAALEAGAGSAGPWKAVALIATTIAAVSMGVASWALRSDSPESGSLQRFAVTPSAGSAMLDSYVGVNVALSPDGDRVVYVGTGPEGQQLWQRRLDELEPTAIPWTEGAENPVFSPDGSMVAFREGDNLETVSLLGGLPNVLLDEGMTGRYIDWGSDGYIYFASDSIIARIPGTGGTPEPVTTRFEGARTRLPHALPDGRGLLVTLRRDAAAQATVGVVGPDGGAVREVVPGLSARYAASGHLVYATPEGTLMAAPFDLDRLEVTGPAVALLEGLDVRIPGLGAQFDISDAGTLLYRTAGVTDTHQPVWVGRDGFPTPIDPDWSFRADMDDSSLALSPDGTRLAVSLPRGVGGGWDIWLKDLETGELSRLTSDGLENRRPAWSSDGASLVYVHNAGGGSEIRIRRADGAGGATTLPTGLGSAAPSAGEPSEALLSADGAWLVFRAGSTDDASNPDLYALRMGGDSVALTLLAEEYVEWSPALSPDGRWLAYTSDETGRSEVFLRPFPDVGSGQARVSTDGGYDPMWSRDGRELFYRDESDRMIAVEVRLTPTFSIERVTPLFDAAGMLRGDGHPMYDVSADGQRLVMLARLPSSGTSELVLVQSWFGELERAAGR